MCRPSADTLGRWMFPRATVVRAFVRRSTTTSRADGPESVAAFPDSNTDTDDTLASSASLPLSGAIRAAQNAKIEAATFLSTLVPGNHSESIVLDPYHWRIVRTDAHIEAFQRVLVLHRPRSKPMVVPQLVHRPRETPAGVRSATKQH